MSNQIYPLFKQSLLAADANSDLDTDTVTDGVYAALVDTGVYTYSPTHQYYSSLTGIIGTPQRITSPTVISGVFDGANVIFSAVTGNTIEAIVLYRQNSGASSTWRLVSYLDQDVTGLPATPVGTDILITWNAAGIFNI